MEAADPVELVAAPAEFVVDPAEFVVDPAEFVVDGAELVVGPLEFVADACGAPDGDIFAGLFIKCGRALISRATKQRPAKATIRSGVISGF